MAHKILHIVGMQLLMNLLMALEISGHQTEVSYLGKNIESNNSRYHSLNKLLVSPLNCAYSYKMSKFKNCHLKKANRDFENYLNKVKIVTQRVCNSIIIIF